jgi:hypothetical protein
MRQKNLRVVITGAVMILLAGCFFAYMTTLAPRSNDPVEMLRTVGQVSGAVAGLGLVMIVYGLIGRKVKA